MKQKPKDSIDNILADMSFEKLSNNKAGYKFGTVPFDEIETVSQSQWSSHAAGAHKKLQVRGWYILTIDVPGQAKLNHMILGHTDDGCRVTSNVVAIAPDKQSAVTRSGSLYPLSDPGTGVPSIDLAMMVVWAFRSWGAGAVFADRPEIVG